MTDLGILEEEDKGQNHRFYIYDYENNEALFWFETQEQAENHLKIIKQKLGEL